MVRGYLLIKTSRSIVWYIIIWYRLEGTDKKYVGMYVPIFISFYDCFCLPLKIGNLLLISGSFLEDCPSFDERLLLFLKWCCCCFIVVVGLQVAKCQSNKARCICLKKDISNILSGLHPHPLFSAFSSSSSAPLENGFLYCLEVFLHIQRWSLAAGCCEAFYHHQTLCVIQG